jgi:hypothetical protein
VMAIAVAVPAPGSAATFGDRLLRVAPRL